MRMENRPRSASGAALLQRGQAALIMVLLLGVGIAAFVYAMVTPARTSIERDKITAAALAQARDALIGRAATDSTIPGSLPCPDLVTNISGINVPNDGSADLLAGNDCPSYIGRLPWRTLGLPDLRDGNGERLWYALSSNFRDHPSASPLNSDTSGQLTITGIAPGTNVIAIVFSPGAALGTQVRDTAKAKAKAKAKANENSVVNYMEGGNETGITTNTFVTGQTTATFNDKLLAITSDALFSVVDMRVAREARTFLLSYKAARGFFPNANLFSDSSYQCNPGTTQGRIPSTVTAACCPVADAACALQPDWDSALTPPPTWFFSNNWHQVMFYAVLSACGGGALNAVLCNLGGLNIPGLSPSAQALVIVTGRSFASQVNRPCVGSPCTATDLLDDAENTNGDDVFVKPVLSSTNNDRLVVVSP